MYKYVSNFTINTVIDGNLVEVKLVFDPFTSKEIQVRTDRATCNYVGEKEYHIGVPEWVKGGAYAIQKY